ncbi:MAG: phosphotransferase [Chloroflexota bacterium]|nr:phosphotransferase [Chloroflexota bacterium]
MDRFIPERIEDLTPEWLTTTLRQGGHLGSAASVTSAEREILGEGEGFMGDIVRLKLSYEGGAGPASVVAKMPRLENRAFGELVGVYERESCFYEEFSHTVPVALPRLYHSDFDRNAVSDRQKGTLSLANRLPKRLMPRVTRMALWAAGRRKRRYLLLLEDLGDATSGDQLAGTDADLCAVVLRSIAEMHAALWESPALEDRYWLVPLAGDSRVRQSMFLEMLGTFQERHPELFDEEFERVVTWVGENGVETIERMQQEAPETFVHGDLRLDNLVFRGDEPVFFDWQAIRRGPAAYDVAWFLSGASDDLTPEDEVELLRTYHAALEEHGVRGYPFEAFERHYRLGLLTTVQTLGLLTILDIGVGENRGADMARAWVRRLRARLETIDLDQVLAP